VIVTGATSGIGRAAAEAFGREGASVVIVGRDETGLAEAANAVRLAGGTPSMCRADVPSDLLRDPTWDHTTAWLLTLPTVDAWLRDRLAGVPTPTSCPEADPATTTG